MPPFQCAMQKGVTMKFKMFLRPAMYLVGQALIHMDKNDTGLDDEIGHKLVELSKKDNLEDMVPDEVFTEKPEVKA